MRYYTKVEEIPRRQEPDPQGSGFFCGHMLVRVNRCRDSHLWYADHIGETFCIMEEDRESFLVRSPDGYTNVIWREDGEKLRESQVPHHGWDD